MNLKGPQFVRYFSPLLDVLKELDGSGHPAEVRGLIAQRLTISDQERSVLNKSGSSRFDNQVHWARFYLAKAGYLDASTRGVWSLTEKSRSITGMSFSDAMTVFMDVQKLLAEDKEVGVSAVSDEAIPDDLPAPAATEALSDVPYRTKLLEIFLTLPAAGFERLCQRLLRESGFEQVTVTGRSGDGGIDGQGVLQLNAFVSFKVLFQCKRYSGAVGSPQVRDFRGAMMGRADKGIIITTGAFTADAQKEALRDGVPPIELVNGDKLLAMFEQLELGLKPRKTFDIDHQFFEAFQNPAK